MRSLSSGLTASSGLSVQTVPAVCGTAHCEGISFSGHAFQRYARTHNCMPDGILPLSDPVRCAVWASRSPAASQLQSHSSLSPPSASDHLIITTASPATVIGNATLILSLYTEGYHVTPSQFHYHRFHQLFQLTTDKYHPQRRKAAPPITEVTGVRRHTS